MKCIVLSIIGICFWTVTAAASEPSAKLRSCVENGVLELLTVQQAAGITEEVWEKRVWSIYRKHTDFNQLGEYLYLPHVWKRFSPRQQHFGYSQFFWEIVELARDPKNNMDLGSLRIDEMRLADYDPFITKVLDGREVRIYRVITRISDRTARGRSATIYITEDCIFFDIQQDARLSMKVDAGMVERTPRK